MTAADPNKRPVRTRDVTHCPRRARALSLCPARRTAYSSTMTALESSMHAQPVSRRGRLKRMPLIGLGLLLLAVLVLIGWTWRHPSAFEDYGGWGVGNTDWRVGKTAYVGMTFPSDAASGWVRIQGADPHGLADSTGAKFAYFVCTPEPGPTGGAIGFASDSDFPKQCDGLVSATGAKLSLAKQQLIVA